MTVLICTVSLLIPRIPPLFGYFLCRTALHDIIRSEEDTCGLDSSNNDILGWLQMNGVLLWFIRILGSVVCFSVCSTAFWNGVQVFLYEVLPGILFLKECLVDIHIQMNHQQRKLYYSVYQIDRIVLKYKQITLMNEMFNNIYQRDFFCIILGFAMCVLIPSGFVLKTIIRFSPIVLLSLFSILIAFEYLVFLVLFTLASDVWSGSLELKRALNNTSWTVKGNLKYRRYMVRSMQMMKIKVGGGNNFIEKNTPFVFLDFVIQQSISVILLLDHN
jgi:hypothetical protein